MDIEFRHRGEVTLLRAKTERGVGWIDKNIRDNTMEPYADIVLQPDQVARLSRLASIDGITVGIGS